MVESMYHLRRINFHDFVTNNNNAKVDSNGFVTASKKVAGAVEELNDGDEPTKNPALYAKSTFILLDKWTKIGRNPELVDVVLNSVFHSNMISRDHSEIFVEAGKYYIQDNSLNGTYVNDYRVINFYVCGLMERAANKGVVENDKSTDSGNDVMQNAQRAFREELQCGPSTSRVNIDTEQSFYITISSDEEDTITEAPKKPEKQLLKEGDVIKFGHVNGAAIKAGEHAPQQSAEFIFKFERALANHLYFGYSSNGVRVQSEKTRAYMQIHSDRLAPQEAYSANTIPKVMPQQTISGVPPPQLCNALPLAVASVSSTTTSSNNAEAMAVSSTNVSTSSASFFQIMAPKQQRQQQAMQRPSATILPNNTSSSFSSSSHTATPVASASSSTVATAALNAAAAASQHQHHQQQLNALQHQQQQAAAAAAAQALVNHHHQQQQQHMAAAAAAASAAPPQPPTAATPALAAMAAATANLTPEEMAAVSAHLRQVVASSDALNSWNANLLQLSRLQQNSAALYGGNFSAAAAAAAAAYLQSGNSLWPNIPQQWRAALQPNTQSAADWMQLNQQQHQQKSAVEYMNSSLQQQLRAAAISNHSTAAAATNPTSQQSFGQQVNNAVASQQQHHRQSSGLFLPAPMPTAASVATTSSSLVTLPLIDSAASSNNSKNGVNLAAVNRLCGGAGVASTSAGVSYASVLCSAASLPSALTSAYSSCTSAAAPNNAIGAAAKPETQSASNSFHFAASKAYSELTTSLVDGQPYLLDSSRLSDKEKAILKAKGGLSGLSSIGDGGAPKSMTYANGSGANGTASSPVTTHLSAANLTSMLPLMRQGMTPLSTYISNPSSLPVDQHFATALAAAINGQNNKMPTSNGGSNFMTSSCSTASSSSATATTTPSLFSTINAAAALRSGQGSTSDLLALHQAANGAIGRLSNGQQSASSVATNGRDELAAQFQRNLQQQQHLATFGSNNSNHSSSSTSSSSSSLSSTFSTPLTNASSGASNNLITTATKVPLSTASIGGVLGVSGSSFKPAFSLNENGATGGASIIGGENGDLGLRKFDFKDVSGMTSINSLAAAMFDQQPPSKQESTLSVQMVKKVPALYDEKMNNRRNSVESLNNSDGKSPLSKMFKGEDETNPISLLKVNPVLIDAASKLTNGGSAESCILDKCGGNLTTNPDLRQLQLAAAAVSQLKDFGSLIQQHQNSNNLQQQKDGGIAEVTMIGGGGASAFRAHNSVKTMECDSSVPSPPKFSGQDGFEKTGLNGSAASLSVSAVDSANASLAAGPPSANNNNSSSSSNNSIDNTSTANMSNALHSPVISTPSRPCSYQSIPQSPPRAPRPQSISPDSDGDESRKRCSSNDSDMLSWKEGTAGSNEKQQLRPRKSKETADEIDATSEAEENCLKLPKHHQSKGATSNEFLAPTPVDDSKAKAVKTEDNKNDTVAEEDDSKRSKKKEKVKKMRKSNELAHLLNDLTYENCSWMYMANRNKNNAKKLADQMGEGSVGGSDGSGEKRRALRLNEQKLCEIQKKKSHKLMRQISDESSDDENAVGGEKPTTSKLKNLKEKKMAATNRSISSGDSSNDDDSDTDTAACNIKTDITEDSQSPATIDNSSNHVSTTTGKLSADVKSKSSLKRHSSSEAVSPARGTTNGVASTSNKSKNANNSSSFDKLSAQSILKKTKLTTQEKRRAAAAAAQLAKEEKEKRSKFNTKSPPSSLNSSYKRKSIINGDNDLSPSRLSKKARPKPKSSDNEDDDDDDEDEPVNQQRKGASSVASKNSKKTGVKKVNDSDASSSSSSSSDAEENRRSSKGRARGSVHADRKQDSSGFAVKQRTSLNGNTTSTKSASSMVGKQQRAGGSDESSRSCGSGKQKSISSSKRSNNDNTVEKKKSVNGADKDRSSASASTSSTAAASMQDNWNYHDPDKDLCAACTLCVKPQHYNINWVQCDRCDGWYHTVCAFGSNTAADESAEFKCVSCAKPSGIGGGGSGKRK